MGQISNHRVTLRLSKTFCNSSYFRSKLRFSSQKMLFLQGVLILAASLSISAAALFDSHPVGYFPDPVTGKSRDSRLLPQVCEN